MKIFLRICFCLLLFACVLQAKSGSAAKSRLHNATQVFLDSEHGHPSDNVFVSEDDDNDGEINFSCFQCPVFLNDFGHNGYILQSTRILQPGPLFSSHFLIILYRAIKL